MTGTTRGAWTLAVVATLLLAGPPVQAVSDADKCEAAKNKVAGKYAFCRQKAEAKAIKTGDPVDYTKCDASYGTKWASAETNGGGMCPTMGDQAAMQSCITAHTNRVAAALNNTGECEPVTGLPASGQTTAYGTGSDGDVEAGNTLSYTDNGDGTITDNTTGLMWEKKDDSGGIHDKDNTYTWCADVSPANGLCDNGTNSMDGTMVTTLLATLNGGGGFAGFTDWRIPNARELQSIVDYEVVNPSVAAAFHQSVTCTGCTDVTAATCSCTQSDFYWSSTTYQFSLAGAWGVDFFDGGAGAFDKIFDFYVRAVRGGS